VKRGVLIAVLGAVMLTGCGNESDDYIDHLNSIGYDIQPENYETAIMVGYLFCDNDDTFEIASDLDIPLEMALDINFAADDYLC